MAIEIFKNTKIFVLLHTNKKTGGSELLHQLVHHLKNLGINAFIYSNFNNISEFHENYNVSFVGDINDNDDNSQNILIYPEAYWIKPILERFKKIRKVLWWLSVDNFYISKIMNDKTNLFFYRMVNKISRKVYNKNLFDLSFLISERIDKYKKEAIEDTFINKADYHLVQSMYAKNHITNFGIKNNKIFYLSDYINEDFLNIKLDLSVKENIVSYNPQKGFLFTEKLIKKSKNMTFLPLINMTRDQVIDTLKRSKVYIDFGNHPGKDRLPREAAIMGCCIITGKRGSASFHEDLPIMNQYKIDGKKENIPVIIDMIKDCLENYEKKYRDFESYREIIKKEPKMFLEDLKKTFIKNY